MYATKITKKQLIKEFNNTLYELVTNLSKLCPDSTVGKKKVIYKGILIALQKSKIPIEIFVQRALIYKEKIDSKDISFLIDNSYDSDVNKFYEDDIKKASNKKDIIEIEKDKKETIDIIKEVKEVWPTITKENQDMVLAYLKLLCMLSQEYFLIIMSK